MVPQVATYAILVSAVANPGGAPSGPSAPVAKVERFREEIYGRPQVRLSYAGVDPGLVRQRGGGEVLDRALSMAHGICEELVQYFADPGAREAQLDKEKWNYPFLYLRSPENFDPAIRLARRSALIEARIGRLISEDASLARVAIYRNGERHFSAAFELAPGLQAVADIDHFRIRTRAVGQVLGTAHGETLTEQAAHVGRIGYFESTAVRQLVVPVVCSGQYVADMEFSFYL